MLDLSLLNMNRNTKKQRREKKRNVQQNRIYRYIHIEKVVFSRERGGKNLAPAFIKQYIYVIKLNWVIHIVFSFSATKPFIYII